MRRASRAGEEGAALLTVLAVVMLLAGFATLGLQRLKAASDRVVDGEARAQAQLLAHAGTSAALAMVTQVKARANRQADVLEKPIRIELDGGSVEIRFRDGGSCFNLNSLSRPPQSRSAGAAAPQARPQDLARLLVAAGIPLLDADTLAQATAGRLAATGMLWADASEWTTVPGVTARHWALAGGLLCALPNREAAALNINSLTPEKAPLLVAMGLAPDEARRALADRPPEGWNSADSFWAKASANGIPESSAAQVVGTTSRWIELALVAQTPSARVGRRLLLDTVRQPATVASSEWQAVDLRSRDTDAEEGGNAA
jgi:general secretion pathway protein K